MNDRATPPRVEDSAGEYVDADDRRIGVAFRRSMWFLAAACVAILAMYGVTRIPKDKPQFTEARVEAPARSAHAPVAIPRARFTDVTKASGIDFVHHNGAYGEKLLPETMGGGVAVIDTANDGRADLLFVDSGNWP